MRIDTWLILGIVAVTGSTVHAEGRLLLRSGFEPPVRVTDDMRDLTGGDGDQITDWESTPGWIESSRFVYLVSRDKNSADFMTSSITKMAGPKGIESHVLCMRNIADDPDHGSTSRNEYSFFGRKPPHDYKQGYARYWMKLEADLPDRLSNEKSTPWYMIMEWKEPNSGIKYSAEKCREAGEGPAGTNNYRINVGIRREADATRFRWVINGEHPQPCRKKEWSFDDSGVEVPFGEWFLVEAYMKKHDTKGRVYFAVNKQVVLDTAETRPDGFTGRTQHADNPLELKFWSPMKNYHGMEWNEKGPLCQWYDDFELWTDFPPGHSALGDVGRAK